MLRSFPSALDFTTFAILLAAIADVVALFRLRTLQPELARPYRAWGHPWLPGLYGLTCAAIAVSLVIEQPGESAIALGILLAGWPLYCWLVRQRGGKPPTPGAEGFPHLD
jgi:APA family basic amino acid/polyamine antiporter